MEKDVSRSGKNVFTVCVSTSGKVGLAYQESYQFLNVMKYASVRRKITIFITETITVSTNGKLFPLVFKTSFLKDVLSAFSTQTNSVTYTL